MTIPAHTSHCMQSLDVSCFKPFKQYLQEEQTHLSMTNPSWGNNCIMKSTLAQMVLQALQKALKLATIMSGFRAIGLFPLDSTIIDKFYGPSIHHLQNITQSHLQEEVLEGANEDVAKVFFTKYICASIFGGSLFQFPFFSELDVHQARLLC